MVKKIIIVLIIIALIGCFIWETTETRQFAGEYVSIDAEDSAYELTLSKTGHINVVDIGAGNPALEGQLYRLPFKTEYSLMAYGETNDVFLNIGKSKADVWLQMIGQTYIDPAIYKTVVIETKTEHMQFNEKGFE